MSARRAKATTALNMTTALSELERNGGSVQPWWRRALIAGVQFILAHLALVAFLSPIAFDLALSVTRLYTPDLVELGLIALIYTMVTILALVAYPLLSNARTRRIGAILRAAATGGDERLAPLIDPQPIRLAIMAPSEQPMQTELVGPLSRGSNAQVDGLLFTRILANNVVLFTGAGLLQISSRLELTRHSVSPIVYIATAFCVAGNLLGAIYNVYWLNQPTTKQMRVTVDAHGVRWRASWLAGWRRIAWSEARAFARIRYTLPANAAGFPKEPFTTVYLLDAPSATLLWRTPSDEHEATYAPAQRLIQLVAAQTRLPLHDLSALASDLSQPKADAAQILADRVGEGNIANPPVALQALMQPVRRRRGAYLLLAYLAFMSLGLWTLVALGVYFLSAG